MSKLIQPSLFDMIQDQTAIASPETELTVLSFGAGQDSTALLYLYAYDAEFRAKYAPGKFLVIMANTGNEHDSTYVHVEQIKNFCKLQDIEFMLIEPEMGYHGNNWSTLTEQYQAKNTIGSKAYPKTCTDRLKIRPIYGFLEDWIADTYDLDRGRKKAFKLFAPKYGKINMLIGIAKGEESRQQTQSSGEVWRDMAINTVYPLVELGLDRQGCQTAIANFGHTVPTPSNCKFCPWMSEQELLWLYRFDGEGFDFWEQLEQNKFKANLHAGEKNLGVWGKWNKKENRPFSLRDALAVAQEKYGHWSDAELQEYKMSHGHCVASKY